MNPLRVNLLQNFHIVLDQGESLEIGSPTSRSLLAYLLLNRINPTDRRQLAFLFWPRGTEAAARRNLRQYLHRLRRVLERLQLSEELLVTSGNQVQINPHIAVELDVERFRTLTRADAPLSDLQAAVELYTGDLLEDIYDDWCLEARQSLRQRYLQSLDRISRGMQSAGMLEDAIRYAKLWVGQETLDENAHRRVMMLYALNGDRSQAVQQYQILKKVLQEELHTPPHPKTVALLNDIQQGDLQLESKPALTPTGLLPSTPPQIPLVGREREMALFAQALQSAQQQQGAFLLIQGESGIGKTRLLQEYLNQHPEVYALRGACHELESVVPYAALRAILSGVAAQLPETFYQNPPGWAAPLTRLLPEFSQRLAFLPAWQPSANEADYQLRDALSNLVLLLSAQRPQTPLHIFLDDLHWADAPTWNFLAHLARYSANLPVLIIGLCRIEDLSPDRRRLLRTMERNQLVQSIPLQRFNRDEAADLARYFLSPEMQQDYLIDRLFQETEGNPFFMIEMLHTIQETGRMPPILLEHPDGLNQPRLPSGIRQIIEARLDRLLPHSRELLATAAVIGRAFTFSLLEQVSQDSSEKTIEAVEEWLQRGLVLETSLGYDFSHDKIRQVASNGLSRARRQFVHRQVADALAQAVLPADAATLAYHYARSDQPTQALPYLAQAGEHALQMRSYHEARQFGLQAISLLGRMSGPRKRAERVDLNLQLAQAYAFTGDLPRAQEILSETEHLAASLPDETRLGEVFYRSSQIFWLRGQVTLAGDYARRTLRSAEELSDLRLLQAALRMLGRVGIALSAFDDAIAYLLRYLNLPGQSDFPVQTIVPEKAIILGYLGVAYARVGSWKRSLEAAQQGLALAEASGSTDQSIFARMQLGFVYADYRDWKACLQTLSTIPNPLEQNTPLTPPGFMLLSLRGRALAHLEQPSKGIQTIRLALNWVEENDYRVFHYLPRLFLAESYFILGDIPSAMETVQQALEQAVSAQNRWATGVCQRLLAECLVAQSSPNWPEVEDHLITSMHILRQVRARPELARTYLALRRLYDRAGQIAWAVDCHYRATSIFEELDMSDELRTAQGQAGGERQGAVVIPNLPLKGPNEPGE